MKPGPRPRRSTAEVQDSILASAAREFAERGYAETTMRSVAQAANVSLSVLHRHYETKAELFTAALLTPFTDVFSAFVGSWRAQLNDRWDDDHMIHEFVSDLYGALQQHRGALLQLVALRDANEAELTAAFAESFASSFSVLTEIGVQEAEARAYDHPATPSFGVWLCIVLVVGQVLMEPWAPANTKASPSGGETLDTVGLLSRMVAYGIHLEPSGSAVVKCER